MPITNTDLFNIVTLAFLFNTGLILMLLAFFTDFPKNVVFHVISAIVFWLLGILIPMTATQYYPAGWAFIILAVANFLFGSISGMGGLAEIYSRRKTEDWEKEESTYE